MFSGFQECVLSARQASARGGGCFSTTGNCCFLFAGAQLASCAGPVPRDLRVHLAEPRADHGWTSERGRGKALTRLSLATRCRVSSRSLGAAACLAQKGLEAPVTLPGVCVVCVFLKLLWSLYLAQSFFHVFPN